MYKHTADGDTNQYSNSREQLSVGDLEIEGVEPRHGLNRGESKLVGLGPITGSETSAIFHMHGPPCYLIRSICGSLRWRVWIRTMYSVHSDAEWQISSK